MKKSEENKNGYIGMKHVYREANRPEPIEDVNKGTGVVKWGDDNLYPQFLNGLIYDSPAHGGIIEQKVKFITAGGIDTNNPDKEILNAKLDGYSWQEIIDELAYDQEAGDVWYILWKKVGEKWFPKTVPFEFIRRDEDGERYHYCENWTKSKPTDEDGYAVYPDIMHKGNATECIQMQMRKPKQRIFSDGKRKAKISKSYYPIVSYSGAITSILAGIEMGYFTFSEVVNGWKGGSILNLANGRPQDDEVRKKMEADIKGMATDRDKQGGMVVLYSNGKENEPILLQMNGNDLDKRYQEAKKTIQNEIMVAHGVISPSLFGVFTDSMFGSKEEMEIAYLLFKDNYIKTRQRSIIEPINWAYKLLNGIDPQLYFVDYTPSILLPKESETQQLQSKLSKEQDLTQRIVMNMFGKCGKAKSTVKILASGCYDNENLKSDFIASKKSRFARLDNQSKAVLQLIEDGKSFDEIKLELSLTTMELTEIKKELNNRGYLDDWELTEKAIDTIINETTIEVVYSYEVRSNVPPAKSGSREFCEFMMSQDKVYTKSEIDEISALVDMDVFLYRGGWYHNPKTNVNTPYCRHEWRQHIILK